MSAVIIHTSQKHRKLLCDGLACGVGSPSRTEQIGCRLEAKASKICYSIFFNRKLNQGSQ
jgi:hypothetical protein